MVAQLEQDLLHLERGGEGLDEDCGADSVVRDADVGLGEEEDVVPEPGLEVVLHFGKVEIGAGATLDELVGVVVEVESKIEEGTGDGGVVDGHTRLVEMPSTGTRIKLMCIQ